jgi:uncharacterized membrane protein
LLATAATAHAGVAARYFVTPLQLTGLRSSQLSVWGINDYGQVCGGSTSDPPFVWTPSAANSVNASGTVSVLPMPLRPSGPFGGGGPYGSGAGWGINNYGQVAGYAGSEEKPLLWSPSTRNGTSFSYTELVVPGGPTQQAAYQINDRGQVVGRLGTLWSPTTPNGTQMSVTRILWPGSTTSLAQVMSINDAGDVGGLDRYFWRPTEPNGNTGTTVIARSAWDLNNTGLAVGGTLSSGWAFRVGTGANPSITVLFDGGNDTTYGHFYSINDDGVAVTGNGYAWTESGGFVSLLGRLETRSAAGTVSFFARAINSIGQIVGRALVDHDANPSTATVSVPTILTPLRDGDANIDQRVNFDDLLILAANYNRPAGSWRDADFTGDGTVNFDDLLLLAANYNQSIPGTLDWAMAQASVPEPASLTLAIVSAGMLRRRARRD